MEHVGNAGDGGPATNASIYGPAGITIDKFGSIYIGDIQNYNVRKITPDGIITTIAGNGVSNYSGDGGLATNASFITPGFAIADNYGNILIADGHGNTVTES
jgi:hypothetical protein